MRPRKCCEWPPCYHEFVRFAFLFPRFKILSGAERLLLKLGAALSRDGHEIHVLCHQFDESCRPLLADGLRLHVSGVPLDYFRNRYVNAAFDYFRNAKLLEALPGNIDAACCFGPALTAAASLKQRVRTPILYFCYEPPRFLYTDRDMILRRLGPLSLPARPFFSIYRRKDRKMVAAIDGVLSNSEFGRRQIQSVYGRDSTVITHGLDPHREGLRRSELRRSLGLGDQEIGVITVNYLHPRKRINLFIDTVRHARSKNGAVRGVIVGDGPEREALQGLAADAVSFAGFVPEEQLYEYFQAADIYLHTARLETFGLSVIEAAGNQLPVVSVNEGGPVETVTDGATGFLRDARPEALAGPILQLAADAGLRKSMGRRGYEYVSSKYSWERGAQDFLRAVAGL